MHQSTRQVNRHSSTIPLNAHTSVRTILFGTSLLALTVIVILLSPPTFAKAEATTRYVATSGSNSGDCTNQLTPCQSIQYAVNQAATGDTILVASGTYSYDSSLEDICAQYLGTTGVICVVNKYVTIQGGYGAGDWTTPAPTANETIIDGANRYRGVLALDTEKPGGITLKGFTIQNGMARGISSRPDTLNQISAFGGGVYIDFSTGVLQDLVFRNNQAVGENTSNEFGGPGSGGAIAVQSATSEVSLSNIIFTSNSATGGSGSTRGGYAVGGAVYTFNSTVTGQNLQFEGNTATAGSTNGQGRSGDGEFSDAQGAAFAAQQHSTVTLTNVTATNNTAIGGAAPNGNAGGAYGGAFYAEEANLSIYDAEIRGNLAQGGDGINDIAVSSGSGLAEGGGVLTYNSNIRLERASVINNVARGGSGRTYKGAAGGGGVGVIAGESAYSATLINTVIAGNRVEFGSGTTPVGGGGGGLWIQGIRATGQHLTLADNEITDIYMFGEALIMLTIGNATPVFDLSDSIIANHTSLSGRNALEPLANTTLNLSRGILANNEGENSNSGDQLGGTTTGLSSMTTADSANFASSGSPSFDYRISSSSPAKDGATGSGQTVDRNNAPRDGNPDFGAYEAEGFSATVAAVADGTLRVAWNPVAGVSGYSITVTCPAGADAPEQGACGSVISIPATASEYLLTGLTNYASYGLTVSIANERTESVELRATPTDLFSYLPLFSS